MISEKRLSSVRASARPPPYDGLLDCSAIDSFRSRYALSNDPAGAAAMDIREPRGSRLHQEGAGRSRGSRFHDLIEITD